MTCTTNSCWFKSWFYHLNRQILCITFVCHCSLYLLVAMTHAFFGHILLRSSRLGRLTLDIDWNSQNESLIVNNYLWQIIPLWNLSTRRIHWTTWKPKNPISKEKNPQWVSLKPQNISNSKRLSLLRVLNELWPIE